MASIKLFENKRVRSQWDTEREVWYFSIVDVIGVLAESPNPRKYWSVLKTRLKKEGRELATNCSQLKMLSADGKYYLTDVADTEQLLRLVQSIPSPKAEPFKQWLARVGYERVEETEDPELALDRAMETYLKKGYSRDWINQRLKSIEVRKELTDEITKAWTGLTTRQYKQFKSLKRENLRDHMTNMELVLNMLAEATTTEISRQKQPEGFEENREIAQQGGTIAGNTRKEIEAKSGKSVLTAKNAKRLK